MAYVDFHFLDVGHGDCTIVEFPNRLTVIDINNCKTLDRESESELRHRYSSPPAPNPFLLGGLAGLAGTAQRPNYFQTLVESMEAERKFQEAKNKLTNPIDYLKARFPGHPIFRYIQTHPDMDHMAGLHRVFVEEGIRIINFWDTSHCIEKDEVAMRTGAVNHDIRDWHTYLRLRSCSQNPTVLRLKIGEQADFYRQDGINIWAPLDHDHAGDPDADPNDLSYVLFIRIGECSVLLGGDATIKTWEKLYELSNGKMPKIQLLKASHHGRKSGYHMASVKSMDPDLTVVSVGELKGKDDAAASYEKFSHKGCFSTVDEGTIIARCFENGEVHLYDQDIKRIA